MNMEKGSKSFKGKGLQCLSFISFGQVFIEKKQTSLGCAIISFFNKPLVYPQPKPSEYNLLINT